MTFDRYGYPERVTRGQASWNRAFDAARAAASRLGTKQRVEGHCWFDQHGRRHWIYTMIGQQ